VSPAAGRDAAISEEAIDELRTILQPLIGVQFEVLKIPHGILIGFEPSQIGTIVGSLMDACIPQLAEILPGNELLAAVGLEKHAGILLDREGYPDYLHPSTGRRLELKLVYVDPEEAEMRRPVTAREPSARITQKVTVKNVDPANDVLLVIAYRLEPNTDDPELFSPTIIDLGLFPMIECVHARDFRLQQGGGKWFGDYETPTVLSRRGKLKLAHGESLIEDRYGRKESEGLDYNEDTNFGKLKRIPYKPLQGFLKKHGATYARRGWYPDAWQIESAAEAPEEFSDRIDEDALDEPALT
jgi:hypothetical protein